MVCVNYRVYSNIYGWDLLGVKNELPEVVKLIENDMAKKDKVYYLIIEHDYIQDSDRPYRSMRSIDEFLLFKEEVASVSRGTKSIHTKKKCKTRRK